MKLFTAFALLATTASFADATFTIAGAHPTSGQMGAAGSTCVDPTGDNGLSLYKVNYHPTSGKGLLLSQASPPEEGSSNSDAVFETADKMLQEDEDPSSILAAISDPMVDGGLDMGFPSNEVRQYGLVDLQGRAAGYTGSSIGDMYDTIVLIGLQPHVQENEAGSVTGATGSMVYSAQGNIVSNNTVPLLAEGFQEEEGCDLADRLYRAVIAVDDANAKARANPDASDNSDFVGDVRCENGVLWGLLTPGYGFPGLQAYLHVDDEDGNELLHIEALPEGGENPFDDIRTKYAAWRQQHPCPSTRKLQGDH